MVSFIRVRICGGLSKIVQQTMEALRKENEELQIEVDDLRESLTKSAIIGQSLLSRNNELEDRITQQEQEFSKRLEVE